MINEQDNLQEENSTTEETQNSQEDSESPQDFALPVAEADRKKTDTTTKMSYDDEGIEVVAPVNSHRERPQVSSKDTSNSSSGTFVTAKNKSHHSRSHATLTEKEKAEADDFIVSEGHRRSKSNISSSNNRSTQDTDDFIFAKYHRVPHSKKEKKQVPEKSAEPTYFDEPDFAIPADISRRIEKKEETKKKKEKRRKKGNKKHSVPVKILIVLAWIIGVLLGLALIAVIAVLIMGHLGISQLTDYSKISMTAPTIQEMDVSVSHSGRTITYGGKTYSFNDDMTSILCLGIDKSDLDITDNTVSTAGQSDAIYLVAFNTKTAQTTVFAIPRDIMTDIGVYSSDGKYVGLEKMQLCLAYAYGDGKEKSCQNTVSAVSKLFYQLPINSYFAMNLDAIVTINDSVGGVTTTVTDNYYMDTAGNQYSAGDTVYLYGVNAQRFLQMRDTEEFGSAHERMQRQISYLKSFTSKAISMTKSDITTPVTLFNIVSNNSVSNLNANKITALATCAVKNGINELNFTSVPGEVKEENGVAEFIVDEKAFYEKILEIYYNEVG